ncbi:RICIN domain-containing protein [Dactylosporangium aurantiacum]|uniref:RICIN domain-containing protein n=1 Tax=Dactylosporangium aurantiacum TaxID=35754 RepID=A0A9Q9MK95_9ACTN|nr:RICIN domain-containing protein [Dactylosporangium aurantiacum]MDG6101543.1 RICIN domain-containing protein [Dactylosporangium aurantiacum]UWZ52617.1 RICIN domain-containing protein [Dactylosporangium aurantiacum]
MRRTLRRLAAAGFGLALAAGLTLATTGPAHAESNGGVRVMPLGDSITDGYNVPGGYRINLWQRLAAGGYTVDFVGSGFNGPASLGDHDHEGHSGWRIDQIDANIVGWLQAYTPRTILLHIGTNDMNQNYDVANAPARLSALIDKIRATAPSVELFVAQITPETDATLEARVQAYNAALPGIVAGKGPLTHLVDMHSAITTADLADGVHPNATGYDKMAARWFGALQSVPGSLTPTIPPVGTAVSLVNPQSNRCLDVSGVSTTPGTQVHIWDCHGGTNQRWTRTAAGELRVYGNRCLDVNGNGTADGTKIQIWDCNGTTAQKFTFNANGSITGAGSGKCVDVNASGTANGTKVQLWTCNGTGAQRWAARP